MITSNIVRIFSALIVIASIIWSYWWLTWVLAIIFLFLFPTYYEILFWGIMYDALYGLSLAQFWGFAYVFTLSSAVLFLFSLFLRKSLLAYDQI